MKKQIIIGVLLSSVFIFLAVRGVDFSEVGNSLKKVEFYYIIPILLMVISAHYLKSLRWGFILKSLAEYSQWRLFIISSIGFMAINILPARLGEFARPYLVKKTKHVGMSSTIATIVVERIFDMLSITAIIAVVLLNINLPSAILKGAFTFIGIGFGALVFIIALFVKRDYIFKNIDSILKILPDKFSEFVKKLLKSFIEGLEILPDIKKVLVVALLSGVIWMLGCFSAYLLLAAFDFELPLIASFTVLALIALGVMLPAAPGFVGTFHYACILALSLFGVSKANALSFAIVLHFLHLMPVVIIGLIFLPFFNLSLSGFIEKEEEELKKEGIEK